VVPFTVVPTGVVPFTVVPTGVVPFTVVPTGVVPFTVVPAGVVPFTVVPAGGVDVANFKPSTWVSLNGMSDTTQTAIINRLMTTISLILIEPYIFGWHILLIYIY
jgi:hypothetical protein